MLCTAVEVQSWEAHLQRQSGRSSWLISTSPQQGSSTHCNDRSRLEYHSVAYMNCYSTPSSLKTALISALGATTEKFASAIACNPKMKHYCIPIAGDAEFDAHSDAFLIHLPGQLLLSPTTLRCSNAPSMGSHKRRHPNDLKLCPPVR